MTCAGGRKAGNIVAGFQPEALAHGRILRAGQVGGLVAGRPDVGVACVWGAVKRRAWLMAPGGHLVVAHQPRQHRQAGRVGRGPRLGPQRVCCSGRRSRPRRPSSCRHFVARRSYSSYSMQSIAVHHQHVPVAVRAAAAFDGRVGAASGRGPGRSRRPSRSSFHARLRARHDDVRDADWPAVPLARAEVGVDVLVQRQWYSHRRRSWHQPAACPPARSRCRRAAASGSRPESGPPAAGPAGRWRAAPWPAARWPPAEWPP